MEFLSFEERQIKLNFCIETAYQVAYGAVKRYCKVKTPDVDLYGIRLDIFLL